MPLAWDFSLSYFVYQLEISSFDGVQRFLHVPFLCLVYNFTFLLISARASTLSLNPRSLPTV